MTTHRSGLFSTAMITLGLVGAAIGGAYVVSRSGKKPTKTKSITEPMSGVDRRYRWTIERIPAQSFDLPAFYNWTVFDGNEQKEKGSEVLYATARDAVKATIDRLKREEGI